MTMAHPRYAVRLKRHLAEYKREVLRLEASGAWRAIQYPHILPADQAHLNLLPVFRDECRAFLMSATPPIQKHQCFHHLNSSQAMCFNLFFPFIYDTSLMPLLLDILGLPMGEAKGQFEKIIDRVENTNFDFFLEYSDGRKVFFELKLSEQRFASANKHMWRTKYRAKFTRHYEPHLAGFVPDKWLEPDRFCEHYQILRNISYLHRHPSSRLIFVFPKSNDGLNRDEQAIRELATTPGLNERVSVLHLETLLARMTEKASESEKPLGCHLNDLKRKYLI